MCGIAGLWHPGLERNALLTQAARMAGALMHRGPDDFGVWGDEASGIALGHRRLSIVDLTAEGHQPMPSADGRYLIVFNGEIYNFEVLRRELQAAGESVNWRGHSDTEVLLAAITRWGVAAAIGRAVGMFAIALWDRQTRTLYLIRDRLGEKPLYYGYLGSTFAFGSELKALRACAEWRGDIDRDALARFIQIAYVPAPRSIYKGIRKLPAGSMLVLGESALRGCALPEPAPYWDLFDRIGQARAQGMFVSPAEAVSALDHSLRATIASQMVADVPLGAFLSGGVDSSTVVALMQAQTSRPVRTFTIGFAESEFNEAPYARAVAEHLGTDHTELYVSPEEARGVITRLPAMYDEPFADSSQIPTYLVSALARQHVTVSLSGDGGDELFGGYNRYLWAESILRRFRFAPHAVRRAVARAMVVVPPRAWDRLFALLAPLLPRRFDLAMPGDKIHKYAALIDATSENDLYERLITQWQGPNVVLGASQSRIAVSPPPGLDSVPSRMMARDTLGYLPDDILVKVDRAAMSVSLETRIPFLDHRIVELAWRVPLAWKIRDGQSKYIVRQLLYQYVPAQLIERPKMGFSIPLDSWLRGPLRPWVEALLDPVRMRADGFLDPDPVRRVWSEHLSGVRNWQHRIWNVLMFQSWLERFHRA